MSNLPAVPDRPYRPGVVRAEVVNQTAAYEPRHAHPDPDAEAKQRRGYKGAHRRVTGRRRGR